jgi:hypothetical protein
VLNNCSYLSKPSPVFPAAKNQASVILTAVYSRQSTLRLEPQPILDFGFWIFDLNGKRPLSLDLDNEELTQQITTEIDKKACFRRLCESLCIS